MFKNANSRILFCIIEKLNFVDENIFFDGKNLISVPEPFDLPTTFSGALASPFLNSIKYFFPSLSMYSSNFSERAFVTDTPTPCKPPEILYELWSNFPPACNCVIITSAADFFSPL